MGTSWTTLGLRIIFREDLTVFTALKAKFFGNGVHSSKSKAKSRLHFVLVQDRTGLTGDEMSKFKGDMLTVLERYFVIDKQGFDIDYKREGDATTLVINTPLLVRRDESDRVAPGTSKNRKRRKRQKAQQQEASTQ